MTREDIIRMAREAGMERVVDVHKDGTRTIELPHPDLLKRFAALVAAEKEQKMIRDGWRKCAEGQRTTQHCALLEAAVLGERERCAKLCEEIEMQGHALWDRTADPDAQGRATGAMDCAAAIRARIEP